MASRLPRVLVLLTVVLCVAQLVWFGSNAIYQVDVDGMAYTGIAAQLRLGDFNNSINAFRSPLISWLIAIVPRLTVLQAGKFITILTFLLTVTLLYVFTLQYWHSQGAAGAAALLFTLARGVTFLAVAFVTPDFLFAALVLTYFLVLLRCLRSERRGWRTLGMVHGLAFLAKGIALPWLAVCTLVAGVFAVGDWKTKVARLLSAAVIPVLVAGLWSSALYTRYGVFTTGSQFKANLLQWTLHGVAPKQPSRYRVLSEVAGQTSGYAADDPMPPGSPGWYYHPSITTVLPRIVVAEARNIPKAVKELSILLTPGIVLGFVATCCALYGSRNGSPEWILAVTVAVASAVLVFAYSMLVIDSRYFFPLIPLWFAIGSRFLLPDLESGRSRLQTLSVALVVLSIAFSSTYRSSPFRVQVRDWQVICREAGASLRQHQTKTVVSIGSGPFPEHGVGWEAGYTSTYFGQARLIAATQSLPEDLSGLAQDISQAAPDAVLVWDMDGQARAAAHQALQLQYSDAEAVIDPRLGEVGLILYRGLP